MTRQFFTGKMDDSDIFGTRKRTTSESVRANPATPAPSHIFRNVAQRGANVSHY